MASKLKDQRRAEYIVPYVAPEPKADDGADFSSTISNTLPMAAVFTRNRVIAWSAFGFCIQTWLNESPAQLQSGKQPAFFSLITSLMAIIISYIPMFFPPRAPVSVTEQPLPDAA